MYAAWNQVAGARNSIYIQNRLSNTDISHSDIFIIKIINNLY